MSEAAGQPSMKRRALWSLVAQGLASTNGLVTSVVAARVMTPVEFGYFSALITVALLFIGLIAALLAQPLLLTRGDTKHIAAQARSTLFVSLVYGAIAGLLVVCVSPFFHHLQVALWILAASFPLVAVSDAFRYFGTVLGRAYYAALVDAIRLVLFLALYVAFFTGSKQDTASITLLWCGCAVVVGLLALWLGERITKGAKTNLRQFATPKFLGYQFSIEYLLGMFGSAIPTLSLGWFVSVVAIGYFRGVSTLFGPILVLATSSVLVISPFLVSRPSKQRSRVLIGMAALFNAATLAWMAVLLLLPPHLGREILGDVWAGSRSLILPLALQMVGIGILTTAQTGIRVARPRYSFIMNVSAISWAFVSFMVGVGVGGLHGAAWGLTVGSFGAAAIAVGIYIRVKDSSPEDVEAPARLRPGRHRAQRAM